MVLNKNIISLVATSLYRSYFIVLYFLLNVYRRIFITERIATIIIDPIKTYIDVQKERFINTNFTDNVDKIFYSKKDYKELLENADNHLEKKWKRNILFEYTPRGNVIMHYDVFKQGFAFYCDTSGISYDILNAVAMKYVYVFRCKDFFIDQNVTPQDKDSPLINIYYKEEKQNQEGKKKDTSFEGAPFAKLKNYNTVENKENHDDKKKPVDKIRNKFINMGRIYNFKITQPIKKNNTLNGFKSNLLDVLSGETQLQKEVLSYKDYKLLAKSKL